MPNEPKEARLILEELWKKSQIGIPPNDEKDKNKFINQALSALQALLPKKKECPYHHKIMGIYLCNNCRDALTYNQTIDEIAGILKAMRE